MLTLEDIHDYIKYMAGSSMSLTDEQIESVIALIDTDRNGKIDKFEMEIFLRAMIELQDDLEFKHGSEFLEYIENKRKLKMMKTANGNQLSNRSK